MTKFLNRIFFTMLLILATTSICVGADISLSWEASPSSNVQGYKVYYKLNNANLPFDSTGAIEGSSPIDVGNTLTTTISGLNDSGVYYFTITAYDSSGTESTHSNIVSNNASVPELISPANQSTNEPVPVTFNWSTVPDVTYTLHYGTDPNLSAVAVVGESATAGLLPGQTTQMVALLLGLALTSLLPLLRRKKLGYASAVLAFSLALTACGGGGGGDSSSSGKTPTSPDQGADATYTIDVGTNDYHQAFDLQPNTTYYWKVVGTDLNDQSQTYSSPTSQFTTEDF